MVKESHGRFVKRAPIWNYFKLLESDKSKATCDCCGINLSVVSDKPSLQSTSSIKRHLKRKHPKEFSKFLEEMNESSDARSNKKGGRSMPKPITNKSKKDNLPDQQNQTELIENTEASDFKSEVLQNVSDNPWQVELIDAFYYLKCPECSFDTMDQDFFEIHAADNHPLYFTFFGQTYKEAPFDNNAFMKNESLMETIMIKNEPIFESNEVGDDISKQLSSTDPIPCLFGDPLNTTNKLKLHIDKAHEGKQLFICVICNKKYKQAYTLKMHYKTLQGENDQVQGNLLRGIENCAGATRFDLWYKSIRSLRRPWTTAKVTFFLYFNSKA
jgi:hypothetical protein